MGAALEARARRGSLSRMAHRVLGGPGIAKPRAESGKGATLEIERTCQQEALGLSRSRHRDDKRVSSEKPRESELSPTDGFRDPSSSYQRRTMSSTKEEGERTLVHQNRNRVSFRWCDIAGYLALEAVSSVMATDRGSRFRPSSSVINQRHYEGFRLHSSFMCTIQGISTQAGI